MKIQEIPVGHVAYCEQFKTICLVGKKEVTWICNEYSSIGDTTDKDSCYNDYVDLGKLSIDIMEKKTFAVAANIE